MEPEPKANIPWEHIEQCLKTCEWHSLSLEQRESIAPFFTEAEYAQARQLLIQSEVLFSEERPKQAPKKKGWSRIPYGIAAAAALTLLISVANLILPTQSNEMAYTEAEKRSLLHPAESRALHETEAVEPDNSATPFTPNEESAPNLGEANLKAKLQRQLGNNVEYDVREEPTPDLLSKAAGEAEAETVPQPPVLTTHSVGQSRSESNAAKVMAAGLPMVRDSIWRNDTLWLRIKTQNGKDSLLPAFNDKGKVWTRH